MDPEYQDELERKGDSLLDEEQWRSEPRGALGYDTWDVRASQLSDTVWIRLRPGRDADWVGFSVDEARGLANVILTEIEIHEREQTGEW